MIEIKVDKSAAVKALSGLKKTGIRARIGSGIRRALEEGRMEGKVRVTARYTRPDYAINAMRLSASGLKGKLTATDRRHSLMNFFASPSTRPPHNPAGGITARVLRSTAKHLPAAFVGKGQIFERISRARLPLKRHTGPAGSQLLGSRYVAPQVERRIQQRLEQEINQSLVI